MCLHVDELTLAHTCTNTCTCKCKLTNICALSAMFCISTHLHSLSPLISCRVQHVHITGQYIYTLAYPTLYKIVSY